MLFTCTKSLKNLLFDDLASVFGSEDDDIHSIHTSCNSLLSVLLIVTCPLDHLHSAVIDNYPMIAPIPATSQSTFSINVDSMTETTPISNEAYIIQWMTYIHFEKFSFSKRPVTPSDFEKS